MQATNSYYRQPSRSTRIDSQRLNVSVLEAGREADWYGRGAMGVLGLGVTGSLHQPVTDRFATRETPVVSGKGVRSTVAHVIIALLCFVLGVVTIMNLVDLKDAGDRIDLVRRDILQAESDLSKKQSELVAKASEVNVGYEAAKLGMVSAKSVETVYLTLPTTVMTLQPEVNTLEGDHLAAILGD